MGLAIDGNEVHGIARGGQAFLNADQAMPNLIGQAIDWSSAQSKGISQVNCYVFTAKDTFRKDNFDNVFRAVANTGNTTPQYAPQYYSQKSVPISTIVGETFIPLSGKNIPQSSPIYRDKNELFLLIFDTLTDDYTNNLLSNDIAIAHCPIYLWVKYNDVKDIIVQSGAETNEIINS